MHNDKMCIVYKQKLFQNGNHFRAYLSQNFDVMDIHAMHIPNRTLKTAHSEKPLPNIPNRFAATIVMPIINCSIIDMIHMNVHKIL